MRKSVEYGVFQRGATLGAADILYDTMDTIEEARDWLAANPELERMYIGRHYIGEPRWVRVDEEA